MTNLAASASASSARALSSPSSPAAPIRAEMAIAVRSAAFVTSAWSTSGCEGETLEASGSAHALRPDMDRNSHCAIGVTASCERKWLSGDAACLDVR